jgi:GxxExxY protein
MPIEVSTPIQVLDQEQFHALDRKVMRIVFDVHNEFGRLLNEELYKKEIARRCLAAGLQPAERQVRIQVSHNGFTKDYVMDLLVCQGYMLEGKAAEQLVSAHRSQSLNYLLLAGMQHGRLVNFRSERIEHEYISTTLTPEERRRFSALESGWIEVNAESGRLKAMSMELLADWGAFLDINLYREALVHLLGGPDSVCRPVQILSGSRTVGTQNLNLLTLDTAFALTTRQRSTGGMREHLGRLLDHTRLRCVQWINLNRHVVEFTSLVKS